MVKNDISQIWVPHNFKKMIKKLAADNEMPLLEYCRKIADSDSPFDKMKVKNEKGTFFKL